MPSPTPLTSLMPAPGGAATPQRAPCAGGCGRELLQRLFFDHPYPLRCDDCDRAHEAAERQREREAREARILAAKLAALKVPPLYEYATLDTFRSDFGDGDGAGTETRARVLRFARAYVARWRKRADARDNAFPQLAVFAGGPGSGKGHIAWSIAKAVAGEHGDEVRFAVLADVIRDLRESWRGERGDESEGKRLARYRAPALLIIDEVSAHALHGDATRHLYDIVAHRIDQMRPTILTTNENASGLADLLGPALASRAAAWPGGVDFGARDYREHHRAERAAAAAARPRLSLLDTAA